MTHTPVRLRANTTDDLQVVAAMVQDALLVPADMKWDKQARTFTTRLNRFCHEVAGTPTRVSTGLQFGQVLSVQFKGQPGEKFCSLLSIQPANQDGGNTAIDLIFSGDYTIRITAEDIDAVLADISAPWAGKSTPKHDA